MGKKLSEMSDAELKAYYMKKEEEKERIRKIRQEIQIEQIQKKKAEIHENYMKYKQEIKENKEKYIEEEKKYNAEAMGFTIISMVIPMIFLMLTPNAPIEIIFWGIVLIIIVLICGKQDRDKIRELENL